MHTPVHATCPPISQCFEECSAVEGSYCAEKGWSADKNLRSPEHPVDHQLTRSTDHQLDHQLTTSRDHQIRLPLLRLFRNLTHACERKLRDVLDDAFDVAGDRSPLSGHL